MGPKTQFQVNIMHLKCFWTGRTSENNSRQKAGGQAGQDKHLLKTEQRCKTVARTMIMVMR